MRRRNVHNPLQRVLCFEPFAAVPVSVARNSELSPGARALYGLISSYSAPVDGQRKAQVARATLAQRLGRCVRTVVRLATELFEHGLVEIVRGSGRTSSIYTLCQFGASVHNTAIENAAVTLEVPAAATSATPIPESYKPESEGAAAILGVETGTKAKRQDAPSETPLADLFNQTSAWTRRDRQKLEVSLRSKGVTADELKGVLSWLEHIERNDFMERVRRQPHLLASQWRSIRDQWDADRLAAATQERPAAVVNVEWVQEWLEARIRDGYTIQTAVNMVAGDAHRAAAADLVRDPEYRGRLEALANAQSERGGLRDWARNLARQIGISL